MKISVVVATNPSMVCDDWRMDTFVPYVDVLSSSDGIVDTVIATNSTCRVKV